MRTRSVFAAVTCAVLVFAASVGIVAADNRSAANEIRVTELAIETSGGEVLFPDAGLGNVVVTPCSRCRPVALLATSRTAWFAGEQRIRFNDLRTALVRKPSMQLVLFYDSRTLEMSRVLAGP